MPSHRASQLSRHRRGAAMVELAIVAPVFVVILLFAAFFTDILRAKLKLQEASRYAAWEMTSHPLADYGNGNHDAQFQRARDAVLEEAKTRYADFDSADVLPQSGERFPFSFALEVSSPTFEIADQEVDLLPGNIAGIPLGFGNSGNAVLRRLGFPTTGQVQVTVRSTLKNTILPTTFMQRDEGGFYENDVAGGHDLLNLAAHNRYTLVASNWMLPDGADQTVRGDRTGLHRDGAIGGLRAQVSRMTFFTAADALTGGVAGSVRAALGQAIPDPLGTFVISHNYVNASEAAFVDRKCNTPGHIAPSGMNNLDANEGLDQREGADNDLLRCFDTAPFRDTQTYADSLYARIFEARGPYFMGCTRAQADDPTYDSADPAAGGDPSVSDRNQQKVQCR